MDTAFVFARAFEESRWFVHLSHLVIAPHLVWITTCVAATAGQPPLLGAAGYAALVLGVVLLDVFVTSNLCRNLACRVEGDIGVVSRFTPRGFRDPWILGEVVRLRTTTRMSILLMLAHGALVALVVMIYDPLLVVAMHDHGTWFLEALPADLSHQLTPHIRAYATFPGRLLGY